VSEKKSEGSQFVLAVVASIVGAGLWVSLASFWDVLEGFLTLITVLIIGAAWVVYLMNRSLKREIADYEETLDEWQKAEKKWVQTLKQKEQELHSAEVRADNLKEELEDRWKLVYKDGLYYHKDDGGRRQAFCRICWETNRKMTTVVATTTLSSGYRKYHCPVCEEEHQLPPIPVGDPDAPFIPDDDEEIPF